MKQTRFASALLCTLSFFAWIGSAGVHVAEVAYATGRALKNLVLDGFKLAVPADEGKGAAVVAFVQAKSFVLRLIKRERPVVSTAWRMCPST